MITANVGHPLHRKPRKLKLKNFIAESTAIDQAAEVLFSRIFTFRVVQLRGGKFEQDFLKLRMFSGSDGVF